MSGEQPEDDDAADPLAWSADAGSDDEASSASEAPAEDDSPDHRASESAGRDAPLEDVAERASDRRTSEEAPEAELFEEQDVTELDADAVWDHVESEGAPDRDGDERDVRVVESADYCERCPYFSEPPELSCSHPGTEIREVLDMDRFRVVDCPKVWENDRLEEL